MSDNIIDRSPGKALPRPIAVFTAFLMWAVAIVLWSISPLVTDSAANNFVIDTALVLASVGFSMLFIDWVRTAVRALVFGVIAIALFAIVDLNGILVFTYTLRMIVPLFALYTPVNRISSNFRIFA
ncbi:hypothetical protein KPL76_04315 [Subtercola sp. PAMC28395]|uniref:hypothetical protein n=1 Tax=Subtercola sp. PAMC28395 TaxID=2846775 RepID=UPI001C0D1A29|nr:hypothetical protein [Subtercola sp. PAMC28395]QWT24614.1 hypothetical protein KPL76_04315 [Subtercola sp. PAMC28395]